MSGRNANPCVSQTPSRINGIPDDDELFLDLRNQVQREPQRNHGRASSRNVVAQGPLLQSSPLNVLSPARDRNGDGLRTIHLVEQRLHGQRGGITAQPPPPPPPSWGGGNAFAGRMREEGAIPSVIRPGPAILAPPARDLGFAAAAHHRQGGAFAGPGRLVRRVPLQAPTSPDRGQVHERQRPVGPRPLTVFSNSPLPSPTHNTNYDQVRREEPHARPPNAAQRRSNVEQQEQQPATTTTQESNKSIKTQIRNVQQLYQGWPTPSSGGA